jgi:hypothetical protein
VPLLIAYNKQKYKISFLGFREADILIKYADSIGLWSPWGDRPTLNPTLPSLLISPVYLYFPNSRMQNVYL